MGDKSPRQTKIKKASTKSIKEKRGERKAKEHTASQMETVVHSKKG